jgi:uncharacterized membrane-anchored protein YhcB (DUF1043 family)
MTLFMWIYAFGVLIISIFLGLIIYSINNKISLKQTFEIKIIVLKLQYQCWKKTRYKIIK